MPGVVDGLHMHNAERVPDASRRTGVRRHLLPRRRRGAPSPVGAPRTLPDEGAADSLGLAVQRAVIGAFKSADYA